MEFDFSKLRGRIVEKYGTQRAAAQDWGMAESVLSDCLNNKRPFDAVEIRNMCLPEHLDIAPDRVGLYFFSVKVPFFGTTE